MYMKDLGERMTLRLTDEQRKYLVEMSKMSGLSPSDFLRMMINTSMYAYNKSKSTESDIYKEGSEIIKEAFKDTVGGTSNENVKTDKHDFV